MAWWWWWVVLAAWIASWLVLFLWMNHLQRQRQATIIAMLNRAIQTVESLKSEYYIEVDEEESGDEPRHLAES